MSDQYAYAQPITDGLDPDAWEGMHRESTDEAEWREERELDEQERWDDHNR